MTGYSWLKAAVFGLLAWNTAVFVLAGTPVEALDAAAWLVLLALFELETGFGARFSAHGAATAIHGARLAAAAAIAAAAIGYSYEGEWLDAANSTLWIAVVVLLEFEVRHAAAVARHRAAVAALAGALYAGLGAVALAWLWRGDWFDGYDALLWLVAFATIEINVLQIARRGALPGNAVQAQPAEHGKR